MTDVGTIVTGYGLTIVTLGFYAAWIVMRGRAIGQQLGIGGEAATGAGSAEDGDSPWT